MEDTVSKLQMTLDDIVMKQEEGEAELDDQEDGEKQENQQQQRQNGQSAGKSRRSRRHDRSTPYQRDGAVLAQHEGRKILSIAAASPVKQVAGSIAHTTRESTPPILSAVGPASVNQAVKAIAIARSYLEGDNIDLSVEVNRTRGAKIKDLLQFVLTKTVLRPPPKNIEYSDLRSAGTSASSSLAGAIAKNVRENNRVRITAIGQYPVFRAVTAIAQARGYLADDGLDLSVTPEFTHVTFSNGSQGNAIQLIVRSHQV